jgi:hypothetical protein
VPHPTQEQPTGDMIAATALIDAMAALRKADQALQIALAHVQGRTPPREVKASAAVRTTSVQVMHALAQAPDPLTLQDIADFVVAIRRGEDEPKSHGGTRYQELCRTAIGRLAKQGLIERGEPTSKDQRMRFRRVAPIEANP